MQSTERPFGLKLIIAYKFVKAPLMLALAIWLTFGHKNALHFANHLAYQLSEGSHMWSHIGDWLREHVNTTLRGGEILAWVDAVSTAVEGFLLLKGHAWGEWIVAIGLAVLIPLELIGLEHHPGWGRLVVLLLNSAVVAYLFWRRLRAMPHPHLHRHA